MTAEVGGGLRLSSIAAGADSGMQFDSQEQTNDYPVIREDDNDLDCSMAEEEGFEKLDEYDSEDDGPPQSSFAMSLPPTPKL